MPLKHVRQVVVILSGKGGVGKSSVTVQLALSLSLKGHNVCILDVDLTGPSIPRLLGIEGSKVTQTPSGWMPVKIHDAQLLKSRIRSTPTATNGVRDAHHLSEGLESPHDLAAKETPQDQSEGDLSSMSIGSLHAMSLAFLLASRSTAIVWRGPKKTAMVRQFLSTVDWPEGTDYLLIDTPPGTSDEHISLVETLLKETDDPDGKVRAATTIGSASDMEEKPSLAGAVIVTTPQAVAVGDVRKELNFCAKTGVKILGVVENMSGYVCPCCGEATNLFSKGGGQVMATDFNVPFLGSVPVDPLWGILVEQGKRPDYKKVDVDAIATAEESSDEDEEGSENVPLAGNAEDDFDDGLLVDKYRDCSLSSVFAEIAQEVQDHSKHHAATVLP